eukprot:TRINITY_DN3395_c0_g1_i4.p1 TRINITY_DN3395_c0_g1~~TRINITY_DN3395_c0_g1_i4.p1  ORF type:complete len:2391 (-),score=507.24 TRINITY_DN3395_c0_g1_i4:2163-8903(-)
MDVALCQACYADENFPASVDSSDFMVHENPISEDQKLRNKMGEFVYFGQVIQLKHQASNYLLAVRTFRSETNQGMQLGLTDEDDSSAWFIIRPRFRVKKIGEKVQIGDEVIFESIKWSRCVHVTPTLHQVTISHKPTAWVILPFAERERLPNVLHGGDILRLLHLEMESWLSHEMIKGELKLQFRAKANRGRSRDAVSLFQVERLDTYWGGAAVTWLQSIRLKHLTTGLYLASTMVQGRAIVTIVQEQSEATLFSFVSHQRTEADSNYVTYTTKLHLLNDQTQLWVHCRFEEEDKRFYEPQFSKSKSIEDVLYLLPGHPSERITMQHCLNLLYGIQSLGSKLSTGTHLHKDVRAMISPITQTMEFCLLALPSQMRWPSNRGALPSIGQDITIRDRQTMCRALGVIDTLLNIVSMPWHVNVPNQVELKWCIYRLLIILVVDYPKNSQYLFQQAPLLHEKLKNAELPIMIVIIRLFSTIYRDNPLVITADKAFNSVLIDTILHLANKYRPDPSCNEFLGVLCSLDGYGVRDNQDMIIGRLSQHKALLFQESFNGPAHDYSTNDGQVMIQQGETSRSLLNMTPQELAFHGSLLNLFSALVLGRNYDSKNKIVKLVNIQQQDCIWALNQGVLPFHIRADYCRVLSRMFVDSTPQYPRTMIHNIRLWSDLTGRSFVERADQNLNSSKHDSTINWDQLRDIYLTLLDQVTLDTIEKAHFIAEVSELVQLTLRFGLIRSIHIPRVFDIISKLVVRVAHKENEIAQTGQPWPLLKVISKQLCKTVDLILDRRFDVQIIALMQVCKDRPNMSLSEYQTQAPGLTEADQIAFGLLQTNAAGDHPFTKALIDMTRFGDSQLKILAFNLLFRMFLPRKMLRDYCNKFIIEHRKEYEDYYFELSRSKADIDKALLGGNIGNNTVRIRILSTTFAKTLLKTEDPKDLRFVHEKQEMQRYLGIHSRVCLILDSSSVGAHKDFDLLKNYCCKFLKMFCYENYDNQIELWDHHFDLLIKLLSLEAGAELLLQVIKGNQRIAVCITEKQVSAIVDASTKEGAPAAIYGVLTQLAGIKVQGSLLVKNQALILRLLLEKELHLILFSQDEMQRSLLTPLFAQCTTKNVEAQLLCSTLITLEDTMTAIRSTRNTAVKTSLFRLARNLMSQWVPFSLSTLLDTIKLELQVPTRRRAATLAPEEFQLVNIEEDVQQEANMTKEEADQVIFEGILPVLNALFSSQVDQLKRWAGKSQTTFDTSMALLDTLHHIKSDSPKSSDKSGKSPRRRVNDCLKNMSHAMFEAIVERFNLDRLDLRALAGLKNNKQSIMDLMKDTSLSDADKKKFARRLSRLLQLETEDRHIAVHVPLKMGLAQGTLTFKRRPVSLVDLDLEKEEDSTYLTNKVRIYLLSLCDPAIIAKEELDLVMLLRGGALQRGLDLLCHTSITNKENQFTLVNLLIGMQIIFEEAPDTPIAQRKLHVLLPKKERKIIKMLVSLICRTEGAVRHQVLDLAVHLFAGGDAILQRDLILYLQQKGDVHFFKSICQQIRHHTLAFQQNHKLMDPSHSIVDLDEAERLFRFLQLLCEGDHSSSESPAEKLQDELRTQNKEGDSYPIVTETINFLCIVEKTLEWKRDSEPLNQQRSDPPQRELQIMTQVLRTLNEYVAGPNQGNLDLVIEYNRLWPSISRILFHNFEGSSSPQMLQLKEDAVTLILSLVEGQITELKFYRLLHSLGSQSIISTMKSLSTVLLDDLKRKEMTDQAFDLGISYYIMYCRFVDKDFRNEIPNLLTINEWNPGALNQFMESRVATIEFLNQDNLVKLYFRRPVEAKFFETSNEFKEPKRTLLIDIDKENEYKRLEGMFEIIREFRVQINYQTRLKDHTKVTRWTDYFTDPQPILNQIMGRVGMHYTTLADLTWYLCLALNIVVISSYGTTQNTEIRLHLPFAARIVCWVLGIPFAILALLRFVGCLSGRVTVRYHQVRQEASSLDLKPHKRTVKESFFRSLLFAKLVFETNTAVYLIAYVAFAIGGLLEPLCYFFHVTDAILRFSVLGELLLTVFSSKKNGPILLQTAILAVLLFYCYATFTFWFFYQDLPDSNGIYTCTSLAYCFMYTLNYGFRAGGGMADLMQAPIGFGGYPAARFIYDLSFFLVLTVILTAIISGIIIDAFGEIRDKHTAAREFFNTRCLVCGREATEFDRDGNGWQNHFLKEHFLWNYLFFMLYLDKKDPADYTAQEAYMASLIAKRDLSFFPLGRATALEEQTPSEMSS